MRLVTWQDRVQKTYFMVPMSVINHLAQQIMNDLFSSADILDWSHGLGQYEQPASWQQYERLVTWCKQPTSWHRCMQLVTLNDRARMTHILAPMA